MVIPYADYVASHPQVDLIPHNVVGMLVKEDSTLITAWRRHLGLTQAEVAERIGISQSAYAQQAAQGNSQEDSQSIGHYPTAA